MSEVYLQKTLCVSLMDTSIAYQGSIVLLGAGRKGALEPSTCGDRVGSEKSVLVVVVCFSADVFECCFLAVMRIINPNCAI